MQQPPPMMPAMPSFPPANITTEQIQKYLDDNKKLILAILDSQNLGKLAECAQYQAQLQKNLMYLAAIADAQPQMPAMPAQMSPHPAMQQGGYFMQHPQAALMAQQPGMFPPRMPAPVSSPHQAHEQQQRQLHPQHHQTVQAQMHSRPGGPSNGMSSKQPEANPGAASSGGPPATVSNARGGHKQDGSEAGPAGGDGQRSSSAGPGVGDGEQSQRMGGDAAP